MKGYKNISFLFLILLIPFTYTYAQYQSYTFSHLTTKDGLSGSQISSIIQDSSGFLWIGTDQGLNKYDGYDVTEFNRPQDPIGISKTRISSIYEDRSGNIWIGTMYQGLYVYNQVLGRFKHYSNNPLDNTSLSNNTVQTIYEDDHNIIWIGTNVGLNRFNDETESFSLFVVFPDQQDHNKNKIASLLEDDQGVFWIGTHEGIFHFDRRKEIFLPFDNKLNIPEKHQRINCFHEDLNGNIWFGTFQGLFKYRKEEEKLTLIISSSSVDDDDLREDVIVSIQESSVSGRETLWIATKNGLVNYDIQNDQFLRILINPQKPNSISNNFINDLYLNNNGILWIATGWSGVNKLETHGNPFYHVWIKSSEGKMLNPTAIFMDAKGFLWVGAYPDGLYKFDQQFNKVGQYQTDRGSFIDVGNTFTNWLDCIYEDSKDNLWVGLGGWGPAIFNKEKESFIYVDIDLVEGQSRPDRILDILEDKHGTLWFAGYGVFYKEKMDNILDPVKSVDHEVLKNSEIIDLFEDNNGSLYFGTKNNGLFCLPKQNQKTKEFIHYGKSKEESPGLYKATIAKIYEDLNGKIWVASSEGLNKLNPETQGFDLINDTTGIFDNGVYQVFGDKKGQLWLSHWTKGLIRYQPDTKSIKIFDSGDGLPFDNLVPRYWYQSDDGKIFIISYLGEGHGFCYFHPDSITDNKHIPNNAIVGFRVKDELFQTDSSISAIKHIILNYSQNFFSFQFAALDHTNPVKNQYAYYLEGLEENWIYSGNRRFARYTSVPPGKYTFRLKGSNNDGYWNKSGTSVAITILPPPWKTWWAYTVYGILVLGLFFAWRRYDLKRQRLKQDLEIEHVEAEKLKELDSIKSRFFANISHEFRTPLTLILGPLQNLMARLPDDKSKQDLNLMQRNALRLQNLINQLLTLSKLESGKMKLMVREENIVNLVNGYIQSFESLAEQKKIDLIFKSDKKDIQIFIEKDKIEKILFNLLSNAFKFTGDEGSIEVEIRLPVGDKGVNIRISDTGKGIPQEQQEHVFDRFYQADDSYSKDQEGTGIGLALTKELVEIHHGTISVVSKIGKGSTFSIFLPFGKEHLEKDEISDTENKLKVDGEMIDKRTDPEILENLIQPDDKVTQIEIEGKEDKPQTLVVDDNADLRAYIRDYLKDDYYISEATNGENGFNSAVENIPDLIISDVMMPIMDGFELCEKLKSDERTSHIPVILLTARDSYESKIEGLELGADDFITKPFDQQELLVRIRNLIQQRNKLKKKYAGEIEFSQIPKERDLISMDQQFIRKAKIIVDKNISNPHFEVEIFATEMALSRVQLHRKLRALVDQSATQFIRTIKLNRAAELLIKKSGTVSEIAYDVGFNTLPYFTKCFHEQFGINPSEFGEKNHNK